MDAELAAEEWYAGRMPRKECDTLLLKPGQSSACQDPFKRSALPFRVSCPTHHMILLSFLRSCRLLFSPCLLVNSY